MGHTKAPTPRGRTWGDLIRDSKQCRSASKEQPSQGQGWASWLPQGRLRAAGSYADLSPGQIKGFGVKSRSRKFSKGAGSYLYVLGTGKHFLNRNDGS